MKPYHPVALTPSGRNEKASRKVRNPTRPRRIDMADRARSTSGCVLHAWPEGAQRRLLVPGALGTSRPSGRQGAPPRGGGAVRARDAFSPAAPRRPTDGQAQGDDRPDDEDHHVQAQDPRPHRGSRAR